MTEQILSPAVIGAILLCYFAMLVGLSRLTAKSGSNADFFQGGKKSPWMVVAIGMIGTSLSGVTFISVPGWVGSSGYSYMIVVFGYLIGYLAITQWLLPLFYSSKHSSIYGYLEDTYGVLARKTGALFFLLSRILGASFRLYLVAIVLDKFVLGPLGIPFVGTVAISLVLIYLYTSKGGIKTIIWTDLFQTIFMLGALGLTIFQLSNVEGMDIWANAGYANSWLNPVDILAKTHPLKQFIGGVLIAFCMTGLDQDMMQKNLSCSTLQESKKNIWLFSGILVFVNFLFLFMGEGLFDLAAGTGMTLPEKSDQLFPTLALNGSLGVGVALMFVLGLVAAAYSSADSAITALTTSVINDFWNGEKKSEAEVRRMRKWVHPIMALVLLVVIVVFNQVSESSVISELLTVAGYTYGPLLGLFVFGMIHTSRKVQDKRVPMAIGIGLLVALGLKWIIENIHQLSTINPTEVVDPGYQFGFEFLGLNGLLCYGCLYLFSLKTTRK
jgi:Na+/proline symporter